MEVSAEHNERIAALKAKVKCHKDFRCCQPDVTDLNKVRDLGADDVVEILTGQDECRLCKYGVVFGYGTFCTCPLRVYIAQKLHK